MNGPLIIYHANCNDGFTAAWIAKKALDAEAVEPDRAARLHPAQYTDPLPSNIDGRRVYVLDFSYPRPVMMDLARRAYEVVWLDHHATAIAESGDLLRDYIKLVGMLRTDRSGAWLAWEWFHGTEAVPDLVRLVDDRDRWAFQDARTRPFHLGLNLRQYTLEDWDKAAADTSAVVADGVPLQQAHDLEIKRLAATAVFCMIDGCPVPRVDIPNHGAVSDTCAELLHQFPGAKFSTCRFTRDDGKVVYSLRSRNTGDIDVGAIAKKFGGGGHKHAAGFAIDANLDNGVLVP
jgi:oligoribonuclease NrnB/cAMP/cGMP phosphodiesterase (DHH superfamily)